MGRLWWPSHLFGRWMTCGCAIRKEILWNLKKKGGWMTSTVCHYHNHGGIDVAIRQKSRPAMSFVYKLYSVSRKCRAWMCKPLLLLRDDCGTKISFLLTLECSYSVFNKRCCYLSFFLSYLRHGKMEFGKTKTDWMRTETPQMGKYSHEFCFFSFFGLSLVL